MHIATRASAGEPVDIAPSSIASTLSAPHVSQLTLDHVSALVEEVFVVSDAEAARGMVAFAEEALRVAVDLDPSESEHRDALKRLVEDQKLTTTVAPPRNPPHPGRLPF